MERLAFFALPKNKGGEVEDESIDKDEDESSERSSDGDSQDLEHEEEEEDLLSQQPQDAGSASGWVIVYAEQAKFDQIFDRLDTANKRYVTEEECLQFFGESKLDKRLLDEIWQLADVNNKRYLTREEFANAVHLISQQQTNPKPSPHQFPPDLAPLSNQRQGESFLTPQQQDQPPKIDDSKVNQSDNSSSRQKRGPRIGCPNPPRVIPHRLQLEVSKCFKRIAEGVAEFESIREQIEQSTDVALNEKLEDNLKREINKLRRRRDQIKEWAASNEFKDKAPLLECRKLIETQMEKYKAIVMVMTTKAYPKKYSIPVITLDPREHTKMKAREFLGTAVEKLATQIKSLEAESEIMQATRKKGKNQTSKKNRLAEIKQRVEKHMWHLGKLELMERSLESGVLEIEHVHSLEESIQYYVSSNMEDDFMEDDEMYDDLLLESEMSE